MCGIRVLVPPQGAADDGSFHPDILYDTATFAAVRRPLPVSMRSSLG